MQNESTFGVMLPYPEKLKQVGSPVLLQKPQEEDLLFIRELWSDPPTMAPVGGIRVLDEATARQWYHLMVEPGSDRDRYFLIRECETGTLLGEASLHRWQHTRGLAELNIKVMDRYRGSGHANYALALILQFFFVNCEGRLLRDDVAEDNCGADALLRRSGFNQSGLQPDCRRWELTRKQWEIEKTVNRI
jgi:RimJ/RimL family protein N-acetyltransferase